MLSDDEITGQQQLLAAHRRTLAIYLQQQAEIGRAYSPPSLVNGIAEARASIRQIKQRLRDAGVAVADHPDDSTSLDVLAAQSHTQPGTAVRQQPSTHQRRRWLIRGILGVSHPMRLRRTHGNENDRISSRALVSRSMLS